MAHSKAFRVQVQKDHLAKLSTGQPVQCLAELIWNALDAEADQVDVQFLSNELGVYEISIKDNGHGILFQDAEALFSSLGGSWKAGMLHTSNKKRFLHGQEGKGRFKAFALGRHVVWNINYPMGSEVLTFSIEGVSDEMDFFRISEPTVSEFGQTGVEVVISELHKSHKFFEPDVARENFAPLFAQYLDWYPEVRLSFQGESISAQDAVLRNTSFELGDIQVGGQDYPASLEVIEWNANVERGLYFANDHGFPLDKLSKSIRVPGDFVYTAYLKSEAVTQLFNTGVLSIHNLDENFSLVLEEGIELLKGHFAQRMAEDSKSLIAELKESDVYPFEGKLSKVEKALQKRFDGVIGVLGEKMPEFKNTPINVQKFHLKMLKTLLNKNPEGFLELSSELGLEIKQMNLMRKLLG